MVMILINKKSKHRIYKQQLYDAINLSMTSMRNSRTKCRIFKLPNTLGYVKFLLREGIITEYRPTKTRFFVEIYYDYKPHYYYSFVFASKPHKRMFYTWRDFRDIVHPSFSYFAFGLVSTPKGFFTVQQCIEKKLGGELICYFRKRSRYEKYLK